jgi:NAD+ synthase
MNVEQTRREIEEFIRREVERWGYRGVLVGLSGGVDSAVAGALAVRGLGRAQVRGLILPERDSSRDTVRDARAVAAHLGVEARVYGISPLLRRMGVYRLVPPSRLFPRAIRERYARKRFAGDSRDAYLEDLQNSGTRAFLRGLAYYRSKHRVRTCVLYFEAEKLGYAVLGTTNRSEERTGFYVKWGDDARDLEPLMHLYKSEVYHLAESLALPERILSKPPSPDLVPGLTDEFAMGIPYGQLDRILMNIDSGVEPAGEDPSQVKRVREILRWVPHREARCLRLSRRDGE